MQDEECDSTDSRAKTLKTSGCEADICFSCATSERISCGSRMESAEARIREQQTCETSEENDVSIYFI